MPSPANNPSVPSDEALAHRAAQGDEQALEQLYLRHQGVLRAQVARHIADSEAVHDIVQDAFIDLLKGLHSYDPTRPFLPWMRVVCRNCLFRYLRQQAPRRGHSAMVEELVQQVDAQASGHGGEGDDWTQPRMLAALRRCLQGLSANHHDVISAHYLEGVSLVDLAQRLGCTANALMVRVHRLRGKLKTCVQRSLAASSTTDPLQQGRQP